MMTIIFTGDWQTEVSNLDRCGIIVDQIVDTLHMKRKYGPTYFVHLGDIKEATNPVDQRVTNFLIGAITRIRKECDGFYFVRGNHDSIQTQDGVPSCAPLVEVAGANAIADQDWAQVNLGKAQLFLVPYFRDAQRQLKAFQDAGASAAKTKAPFRILAFHNEIEGCQKNPYVKGVGPLTPTAIRSGLYRLCVGGHIHRPQIILPNIHYAGSPFCCNWGEVNERKSFMVVTINNEDVINLETIPTKVPGWYDRSVPGFTPQKDWTDCHIRCKVPVALDPIKEMNEMRQKLGRRYPGAILHLTPDFQKVEAPGTVDLKGGDQQLLRNYLEKLSLPEDISVDRVLLYLRRFLPDVGLFGVQGLRFLNCEATEVLSFRKISLDLENQGLTLVTGRNLDWGWNISNGSGKSSLVSLPFIALFGKTFKGQQHDEWARQGVKCPAEVSLRSKLPDGRLLRIVRGRRPANLRVYLDDQEVTQGDINGTQRMIEKLTNLTWSVLTNSVYIGQREIGSVFGTEKDRKELFSRLLGLDRFLDAQEKLRKIMGKAHIYIDWMTSEIESTQAALSEANAGLGDIEKHLQSCPVIDSKDIQLRERQIGDLEQSLKEHERDREAFEPILQKNQKEFEDYLFKATDAEAQMRTYRELIEAAMALKDRCPTCGGRITVKQIEAYTKELETKIEKADEVATENEQKQEDNRRARAAILEKIQKNDLEDRQTRKTLDIMRRQLTQLQEQADARKRLEAIRDRKTSRVSELTRRLEVHSEAHKTGLEFKRFIEICSQTVGRDGLPAYLASIVVPQLNAAAIRYSQVFSEGEIGLRFEISGGDIDVEVVNVHGGKGIKDQSMGEMRMAGLIAAFAFRDVLVPHSILILDEPGEGLDGENAKRFARGLNEVAAKFGSVFIISHNERVLSELEPDHHLIVTKKDGVSTVKSIGAN
jgi:DNA repair exonuclease SbcCD nuclease subunit/tetratricopeptide (TPR) repeat protein